MILAPSSDVVANTTADFPVPTVRHAALALSMLLLLLQLLGGAAGEGAAFAAILLAAVIGWRADYRYLGVLLILCLPAFGFATGDADSTRAVLFPNLVATTRIGGVAVAAPLALMLAAAARILADLFVARGRRVAWPSRWPLFLFLACLVLAGIGALHGRAAGLNRWSEGFRSVLAIGGAFWGFALTRGAGATVARIRAHVARLVTGACAIFAAAVLRGHFYFLLAGLAVGMLPYFLRNGRVVAAALAAWVCAYAIAAGTLTTAAIVIIAGGCVTLTYLPAGVVRRWAAASAILVAGAASVLAVWAVMSYGEDLAVELSMRIADGEGLVGYAIFKLMGDRGPLWLAAVRQIADGPLWIAPSGRPLLPAIGLAAGLEWEFGPHNSLLQLLRNTGLAASLGMFALIGYFLLNASRVLTRTDDGVTRALAAGFIAIAIAGMTTGDFPVTDVGFFVWLMGGLVIGMHTGPRVRDVAPAE